MQRVLPGAALGLRVRNSVGACVWGGATRSGSGAALGARHCPSGPAELKSLLDYSSGTTQPTAMPFGGCLRVPMESVLNESRLTLAALPGPGGPPTESPNSNSAHG